MKIPVLLVTVVVCYAVSATSFYDLISDNFRALSKFTKTTTLSLTDGIFEAFNVKPQPRKRPKALRKNRNKKQQLKRKTTMQPITSKHDNDDDREHYTVTQQAIVHGMRIETHTVQTQDGYFLTLHRILGIKNISEESSLRNQTVLLHHGLLGSSSDWILLGPEESLPYILVRAGCDVWLANARGNYYSRAHISKSRNDLDFWKFSWQEIGEYDLAAVINYIDTVRDTTHAINYIGHSLGATALLTLLSSRPQYNSAIRIGILLAPLAFMSNINGPMSLLLALDDSEMEQLKSYMGRGQFVPNSSMKQLLLTNYCKTNVMLCENILLLLSGTPKSGLWNTNFTSRLLNRLPSSGSADTIYHYIQVGKHQKIHRYNDEYSEFAMSNVTAPIALLYSSHDWLSTVPDVLKLYKSISNPIYCHMIDNKGMVHTDFVWGVNANRLVFTKVLEILENSMFNDTLTNEIVNN